MSNYYKLFHKKIEICFLVAITTFTLVGCGEVTTTVNIDSVQNSDNEDVTVDDEKEHDNNSDSDDTEKANEDENTEEDIVSPIIKTRTTKRYNKLNELEHISIYEFDSDGDCIKETNYDENNQITDTTVNEYDEHKNRVKTLKYDPNGTLYQETIHEYDENDNHLSGTTYSNGIITGASITTYYDNGNEKIRRSETYSNGVLTEYDEQLYPEAGGNALSWTYYKMWDGSPKIERYYEYSSEKTDDGGYLRIEIAYDGDSVFQSETDDKYDSDGNLVSETKYKQGTALLLSEYTYNTEGKRIKSIKRDYNSNNLLTRINTYYTEYDSNGLSTKYTWYMDDDLAQTILYEYDDFGKNIKTETVKNFV